MGVWDKKEAESAGRKSVFDRYDSKPEQAKKTRKKPQNGDNIDYEALNRLEQESTETARNIEADIEGIAGSIEKQKAHHKDLLSTNYWFAVCFNNQTQKEQFLKNAGFNPADTFIYGNAFSKRFKIDISEPDHDYSRERKNDRVLAELARRLAEEEANQ